MKLAARITALFLALAGCTALLLVVVLTDKAFDAQLRAMVDDARAETLRQASLQLDIYAADEAALTEFLSRLVPAGDTGSAAVYDTGANLLVASPTQGVPGLSVLRGNASPAEEVVVGLDGANSAAGTGLWSALTGKVTLYASVPVFTSVDPNRSGLSAEDFIRAGLERQGGGVVAGYVVVGQGAGILAGRAVPEALPALGLFLILAGVCCILLVLSTRELGRPITQLRALGESIRAGNVPAAQELQLKGEFRDVAEAIADVMQGLERRGKEIAADQKLLNLRADESASRLSDREEELRRVSEEMSEARDRLHRASYYDSLTSLPNRALFAEQFRQMLRLRERDQRPLALLLVNLKNFRRINESLGHSIGDLLLAAVATRLTGCVRGSDIISTAMDSESPIGVSRLGGDEFALVLNQLDSVESAGAVAQRLVDGLAEPFAVEAHEIVVAPSIGIAIAPTDGDTVEDMLRAAATAMQHDKQSEGNGYRFFSHEMQSEDLDRFRLEAELRRAIERDQLLLHYQPQVDTFDGAIIGAEALLRWQHPEFGMVPPYQFIPLAEEAGLIGDLGRWVLGEACRQLVDWRARGLDLPRVAINVSAQEFSADFCALVRDTLAATGLEPQSLELGLAEGILADARSSADRSLRELADSGVYLAVDGFGTGGAPLSLLGQYALHEIKIDRSFVMDCDSRAGGAGRLVQGIIAMTQSLGLRVLAEGVESEAEYRFLSTNGVRAMQGYLFSEPVTVQELEKQLSVPWFYMSALQRMALSE